jgi:hypothetical protein
VRNSTLPLMKYGVQYIRKHLKFICSAPNYSIIQPLGGRRVDDRLGSRLRGYHPVAPRPLRYGPFVHHLQFRPSSPKTLHVKRHERPLLVKDGIGREMAGQFGLRFRLPRKTQGSFTCHKCVAWNRSFTSPPKEGMLWIFSLRPGSNPRSWLPDASILTNRPLKPLEIRKRKYGSTVTEGQAWSLDNSHA